MSDRRTSHQEHIYSFVPGEAIDVVVLAAYLRRFIDGTATIKPSRHPRENHKVGFTVGASRSLAREALEDVIKDTNDWVKEQQSDEFEDAPYDYQDSDIWSRRRITGPTPAARDQAPVVTERRKGRHDADNPRTLSELSPSTQVSIKAQYTHQASKSSRHDPGYSDQSITPSPRYQSGTPRYLPGSDRHPPNDIYTSNSVKAMDKKGAGRDGRQEGDREGHGGEPTAGGPRDAPDMMAADRRREISQRARATDRKDFYAESDW